ncbi:hypothetical protein [Oerskovia enterophila]|uniref:hypothetical protein n=1 Tax=Oerskovia enterophila TaxID=43678 RepID=UPI00339116E7
MSTSLSAARLGSSILLSAALLACAACTPAPPQQAPEAPYTPPAWMAEQRQTTETFTALQEACARENGYAVTTEIDGGVSIDLSSTPPEQQKAFATVLEGCYDNAVEQMGEQDFPTADVFYDRVVDTHACLLAEGHSPSDPPSRETWIDSFNQADTVDVWSPYAALLEAEPEISEDEWYRLKSICVEDGIVFTTEFAQDVPNG